MTSVGFEPTPFQTAALTQRLRPLGQLVANYNLPYRWPLELITRPHATINRKTRIHLHFQLCIRLRSTQVLHDKVLNIIDNTQISHRSRK